MYFFIFFSFQNLSEAAQYFCNFEDGQEDHNEPGFVKIVFKFQAQNIVEVDFIITEIKSGS